MKNMKCYNQVAKVAMCDGKINAVFHHTEEVEVPCIETKPHIELIAAERQELIGHTQPKLITHKEV